MNKVLVSMMFGAFLLTSSSFAQTPPAAAAPVAPAATTTTTTTTTAPETMKKSGGHREGRHPELRKALRKLHAVKQDLEKAKQDFGGHKAKALEAIDTAIEELRAGLEAEKK